eukprot:2156698-Amphidinium_carterae.2
MAGAEQEGMHGETYDTMSAAQCPAWLPDYIRGAMVIRKRNGIKEMACRLCVMNIGGRKEKWYKEWDNLLSHFKDCHHKRATQAAMYYDTRPPEQSAWTIDGVALHPSFKKVPDQKKLAKVREAYDRDVARSADSKTQRLPGQTPQAVMAKVKAGMSGKEIQTRPGTNPAVERRPYPFGPIALERRQALGKHTQDGQLGQRHKAANTAATQDS